MTESVVFVPLFSVTSGMSLMDEFSSQKHWRSVPRNTEMLIQGIGTRLTRLWSNYVSKR